MSWATPKDLTHTWSGCVAGAAKERAKVAKVVEKVPRRAKAKGRPGELRHFEAFGYHLMQPGLRLTADPRNGGTLRSRKTGIMHGDFTLWSCPRLGFKEILPEHLAYHHVFSIRLLSKSPFLGLLFWFSILCFSRRFTSHSLHAGRTPSQARWGPGGSRRQVPVVSVGNSARNSASSASLCFHAKLPAKLSSLTPGPQVL